MPALVILYTIWYLLVIIIVPMPVPILTFSELLVIGSKLSARPVRICLIDHMPEYLQQSAHAGTLQILKLE